VGRQLSEPLRSIVDCNGRNANVELIGRGVPVVLVGSGSPMAWVDAAAHILGSRGYEVINYDYSAPTVADEEPEPRTALNQIADVVAIMDEVGVSSAHLVGLSRGAITAYGLSVTEPSRVESLTLAFPVAGHADTLFLEESSPKGSDTASADPMRALVETVFSSEFLADHYDEAQNLLLTPPGTVRRVERAEEEPFPVGWLASCPVMIMEGGGDKVVGPTHPGRYAQDHPSARRIHIPGASHGWLMERPEEFADYLAAFVAEVIGDH
jgi:pimeloyl-ACP methyl ester carboxylesterase